MAAPTLVKGVDNELYIIKEDGAWERYYGIDASQVTDVAVEIGGESKTVAEWLEDLNDRIAD